jgi:predicted enzyme related to lactoylglutathione lyase
MAYKIGNFVWFEHFSSDPEASKSFYAEVLGWTVQEMEMGDGSKYTMLAKGDKPQCGVLTAPPDTSARWNGYLSVPDVDAAVNAAGKAGGKTLVPAMDIPTIGRFALLADTQGGTLSPFRGAQSDDNASTEFHWMELWTADPDESLDFYTKTFDFTVENMNMPGQDESYRILKLGENAAGGVMKPPGYQGAAAWVPFISVDDADATLERAKARGATVVVPAMDVPNIGRFTVFTDPSGARVGVIKPAAAG